MRWGVGGGDFFLYCFCLLAFRGWVKFKSGWVERRGGEGRGCFMRSSDEVNCFINRERSCSSERDSLSNQPSPREKSKL